MSRVSICQTNVISVNAHVSSERRWLMPGYTPFLDREVWQRFAGKWATCDPGQKPCTMEAQVLLTLKGF